MDSSRSVREVLGAGTRKLTGISESPRLDAEILLRHCSGLGKTQLITAERELLDPAVIEAFLKLIERRALHEPVAYLIGHKEFYGREFFVSRAVLCPRPETELLIEIALERASDLPEPLRFIDLGTGSGCIAVTLASELKDRSRGVSGVALDISAAALLVAYRNALAHSVADQVQFQRSEWLQSIPREGFHLLLSNPPYVPIGRGVSPELAFEPPGALFAGADGLNAYRQIFQCMNGFLASGGSALFEIGFDQGQRLLDLARNSVEMECEYSLHQDLAGHDRVFEIRAR